MKPQLLSNSLPRKNRPITKSTYSDNDEVSEEELSEAEFDDISEDEYYSNEEVEDDDAEEHMKRELADVPMGQLMKLQKKLGQKEFRELKNTIHSVSRSLVDGESRKNDKLMNNESKKPRRENKNQPMEMSAKRPVSRFRKVVETAVPKRRDPRFDNLCGKFNEDLFQKSFSFLDDFKRNEMKMIKEKLKQEKNIEEKNKLEMLVQRMQSQEATRKEKERERNIKREWKKKEMDAVKQGKVPYFLKKAEVKKLTLISKFKDAPEKSIDKLLEKRRKKNASKEKRYLPYQRK
ncbi:hypothetical protein BKA69DRAFT_1121302 [Paraphysoderma sedebokerense]|nr:hypothetical protein BKA69DRAFT_1121302 [Paraphysoderma sedebokerense]